VSTVLLFSGAILQDISGDMVKKGGKTDASTGKDLRALGRKLSEKVSAIALSGKCRLGTG
jgi:hypothetical protein